MRRYPPFSARSGWSFAEADALICLSLPWRDLWEDPKTKCREECTHQPWAPAPVAVMASSSTGTKPAGKQKSGAVFGPAPVGKSRQRLGSTTVTVLASLLPSLACLFAIIAAARLAALVAGLGGALGIIGEIAAALLAALVTGLGGALGIIGEIAAALLAALVAGLGGALGIIGKIAAAATIICHCVLLGLMVVTGVTARYRRRSNKKDSEKWNFRAI